MRLSLIVADENTGTSRGTSVGGLQSQDFSPGCWQVASSLNLFCFQFSFVWLDRGGSVIPAADANVKVVGSFVFGW